MAADIRYRWSADAGIDLLTGPGVVVRAYVESFELANLMSNAEYVYPGFDRAAGPNNANDFGPRPDLRSAPKHPPVGTDYRHILRIERTGRDVFAFLCNFGYAVAFDLGDGKLQVNRQTNSGTSVTRLTMIAPVADPAVPLPPQKGPLPAPGDDVFGQWRITANELGLLPTAWPTYPTDLQACIAQAPDPVEKRDALMTGEHSRADFPTLPPYPGWPSTAG